ncbi:putative uncharacterized protein DDB_G0279653 [Ostrea edulis]|uniref:putative uncharacterized protein DDB_G0279653 n=1 Tax=Ostrea edulis TaxID=37623 RepID=UPI0024AFD4A0|nr:putative uncharacterized protein DDB_G0279653 [Ostrea edulis]
MAVPNTRNRTVSNSIEDLLKEISEKLSLLIEKIDSNHEPVKLILDTVNQHFENMKDNRPDDNVGMESAANNMQLEKEISVKKNIIIRTWKRNLNERKQAFWNAFKTENTVDIYKNWRRLDLPIMPRKFRIKEIAGEDETERAIRENLAAQKFDAEIALLETRSTRYTTRFQNIDIEMEHEIKKISTGEIQTHLLEKWKKDTDDEEEKSKYIWAKKKLFYDNYEENYGTINLDRNQTPKGNKSFKPNNRNQRRNNNTYAEVTRTKYTQHMDQGNNQRLRSSVNVQRQHRNLNQRYRDQRPVEIGYCEESPGDNHMNYKRKYNSNDNINNNSRNNTNNSHGKPFLWRGKIQKYRWKCWA